MPAQIIPIGAVYRLPSDRLARVQHCGASTVTLAYLPDPSPAADPVPDGDSVTVPRKFLLQAARCVSFHIPEPVVDGPI